MTFNWELLGRLGDPAYRCPWECRRQGGGLQGTLIETRSEPIGGLSVAKIIEQIVLG